MKRDREWAGMKLGFLKLKVKAGIENTRKLSIWHA
jgi:hypothetical protein